MALVVGRGVRTVVLMMGAGVGVGVGVGVGLGAVVGGRVVVVAGMEVIG